MKPSNIGRLQRAVEGDRKAQAKFKEKVTVREELSGDLIWKGEVYIFHLVYTSHFAGSSKEKIAQWELGKPTASTLEEAEARGLKIKEDFQTFDEYKSRSMRKAKLAYAWTFDFEGADEDHIWIVAPSRAIKTPSDAVKRTYAAEFGDKS